MSGEMCNVTLYTVFYCVFLFILFFICILFRISLIKCEGAEHWYLTSFPSQKCRTYDWNFMSLFSSIIFTQKIVCNGTSTHFRIRSVPSNLLEASHCSCVMKS